ncbi:MAG TPA: DUF4175 family protein, partial [Pyrinomonadaceae bacterium]|nr:DUF4175 family protein [Pyrinomonadaceae bacterium]
MKYASDQLTGLIHAARRRRQLLIALRGVAIFLFACAAIILLTGWAANRYRYNDAALLSLRVGAVVALLAAVYLALVRPLWKRVSDAQLGMLIEERRPDLSHRLVSAIEFSTQEGRRRASPAIVDRLLADANGHAGEVSLNEVVHRRRLAAYAASAVACLLLFAGVLHWGPSTLFTGVARLVSPVTEAASTNSLAVMVKPGTARVPKGSDQEIVATLVNFDAEVVSFFARPIGAEGSEPSEEAKWDVQAMEPAKSKSDYQFFIFNIQNATEYFVEANGVRSETFKLDVVDVPFVKQLNLTLSFPSYTRLAVQTIEDGGDITALKGTVALVTAQLTGKAKAARIVLRDGRKIEMRGQGETNFIGALTVTGDSSYHIELVSIDGDTYSGSNEHDITLLEDQPPTVAFEKPGRDTKATSVEEVFTQVKAEDDYGVASIEMFFSVNGGAEQKVNLQKLSRDAARALSGVHTFFLEEHGLKPGDFISYYAKARDASNEVSSDIYFVEVKPFDMQYKQAQQQGGGGGGGGGEDENALTKRQKELIAATFRLMREAATTTPKERADNYNTVATGQERLRNDAREFVERIRRRLGEGMEGQEELAQMVEHLNEAAREMEVALPPLKKQIGKDALPAEQRALQNLLRADAIFREMQVASGNQEGGGGGQQQQSEELTDLFELELDKMKNQYETLNREGRQQAQQGKDEATRKLEELARRQQQALEQQQRRQQSGQPRNGGGGGGSQRQQQELIEETRKAARELERLSRERRDPRMQELSRQLNQAADDMQKAQAASESGNGNEAAEQNRRALERLEAARQRMGKSGQANRGDEVGDLRKRAADAAARQREITKDVEEMARRRGGDAGKKQQLAERKDALADALNNLEQDVEQAARAQ